MFKKIMNVLSIVVLIIIIIAVLFFFMTRIMGDTPSVFGFYVFRVTSDSMEPTLEVGDVLLVKSVPADEIKKNDIITFRSTEGSMYDRNVTHRVVEDPEEKRGKLYFQTQGDAPNAPLDKKISEDQVEGRFVRKLVLLGKFFDFMSKPYGIATFIGLIVVLFGYELVSLTLSYKKIDEADDLLYNGLDEKPDDKKKSKKKAKKEQDSSSEEKSEIIDKEKSE